MATFGGIFNGPFHVVGRAAATARDGAPGVATRPHRPHLRSSGRDYHLFGGPVDAATRIGHWITKEWFDAQSPSIFWPEDHSWCVATEVDADTTLVGGSRDLIAEVTNSSLLEALLIGRGASQQDTINPG